MSFSFDINLTDKVSQVRSIISDTDSESPHFADETIQYLLTVNHNRVLDAAKECAFRLYTTYLQYADVSQVDGIRLEYRSKANLFKALYEELKRQALLARTGKVLPIHFGGLNRNDFNSNREDQSLTKPKFTQGNIFHDYDNPENTPLNSRRWNNE